MSEYAYELRQTPHRHYAVSVDGRPASWNGAGKTRIVSVTTVLDGGQDTLTGWATRQGVAAGEMVARRELGVTDAALDATGLAFGELAALQPEHPDTYRDHKAALGTALHEYLASQLAERGWDGELPHGLRAAVDSFMAAERPHTVNDARGWRVERAVGDYERAVAGTYDAQVWADGASRLPRGRHRIDAKSSNTIQPKHFAQLAEYEREAVLCGEEASDWLTLLHFTPMGEYHVYSIAARSPEHRRAQTMFDAYLLIYRSTPVLGKLIKHKED